MRMLCPHESENKGTSDGGFARCSASHEATATGLEWRQATQAPQPWPPKSEAKVFRPLKGSRNTLMILPQVHLRKPCYDFYFL